MASVPEVDVVIPTIGRNSLQRAVESVLAQTHPARVIVVLDEPHQEAQVRGSLPEDERVRLVLTDGRLGGAAARNIGIDAARAPVIAFLDDDDWWDRDSLQLRLRTVNGFTDLRTNFFVAGTFWHESSNRATKVPRESPPYGDISALAAYLVQRQDLRFGRTALQSSTIVLSADVARRVRWETNLAKHQDWDFALRVLSNPSIQTGWLEAPTVHVEKDSPKSISKRMDAIASLEFLDNHPEISGRARADFLAVHVLRASLVDTSPKLFFKYLRSSPGLPHLAAIIVGASGIRNRKKS